MDNKDKKQIDALYHRLSLKYNISKEDIKNIVESPYLFTKEKLKEIDVEEIQSEEDADITKTNFMYKYIGKLHTNFNLINRRKKQSEAFKKINKKKWEKNQ
jgi:CTP synthase (UTP-ammonia lyase)